mgnify:CR=1 FL=1
MFKESPIIRRKSRQIMVGNVPVGGDAPISVQSMTNTLTTDVAATVAQIRSLEAVGADIVRVSVPTMDAAEAFREIKKQVKVPLVTDIHFDYRIALKVAEYGADCLRINPGNIGREDRVKAVVDAARDKNIPIRIGVNGGSLEKDIQEKYVDQWKAKYPDVEISFEGDQKNQQEFASSLASGFGFALIAIYILLAVAFNSYSQPFIILTALPFAYMGAVLGHLFLGMNFSLYSIMGIVAAAGVVVNDNLVLLDFLNNY